MNHLHLLNDMYKEVMLTAPYIGSLPCTCDGGKIVASFGPDCWTEPCPVCAEEQVVPFFEDDLGAIGPDGRYQMQEVA